MNLIAEYSHTSRLSAMANTIGMAVLLALAANLQASVFNVTSYGAVGDGTTDNTAAINAAIAAVNAAPGGSIYFPAGNYYYAGSLSAITKPCTVYGDVAAPLGGAGGGGSALSSGGGYGLVFNYSGSGIRLTASVHDIALLCTGSYADAHVGINYIPSPSSGATDLTPSCAFKRITFSNWGTAIYFKNLLPAGEILAGPIEDCEILGQGGNSSPTALGINIQGASGAYVRHCNGQWLNTFVLIGGNSEGEIIDGCQIAACYKGITLDAVTGNPQAHSDHTVTNCYIQAATIGLDVKGYIPFCIISNDVFQANGSSSQPISVSDTSGINESMLISGISLFGGGWGYGITFDARGIYMSGCSIFTKPIHLTSRADNISIQHNVYSSMDSQICVVNDNGGATGDHVGDSRVFNGVVTVPSGAGTSYTATIDISTAGYTSAGAYAYMGGTCQCTSDSAILIRFNWDAATQTRAQVILSRVDGGTIAPGLYRYNLLTAAQ